MDKVHNYICKCSRGDWFVLYQLSKNLNRPFFMDFLVRFQHDQFKQNYYIWMSFFVRSHYRERSTPRRGPRRMRRMRVTASWT